MEQFVTYYPAVSRILMGLVYLVFAAGLVKDFNVVTGVMASKGVPMPSILLPVTIAIWVIGGALLIAGIAVTQAVILLFLLTVAVTPVIYNFWAAPPEQFPNELQHFLKNLAMLAGLLAIAALSSRG